MSLYASKTLAERNSDPLPYRDNNGESQRYAQRQPWTWSTPQPRPEFQHGKLEANPILVAFRSQNMVGSVMHADLAYPPTDAQIAHARRVLKLRSTVYA